MATKKFTESMELEITPKSKNAVYQYVGTADAYTFTVNPSVTSDYDSQYKTVAVKNKNNLVITTLFTTESGKTKKVTTTVKDYYLSPEGADYTVAYKTTTGNNYTPKTCTIKLTTMEGVNGLYGTEFPVLPVTF